MSQYVVITPDGKRFGPTDFQTLSQWTRDGRVGPGMTVEDLLTGQTMSASGVPGLFGSEEPGAYYRPDARPQTSRGTKALIWGIVGMVAWCLPLAGLAVGAVAIVQGVRALDTEDRVKAIAAIIFGVFSILLSIANAVLGAILVLGSMNR